MEHKYRAWDGFNGEYIYSDNMNAPNEMLKLARFFENCAYAIDGGNNIIIERYIGIKDENKTCIYEGDIVDCLRDGDEEYNVICEVESIKNIPRWLFGSSLISRKVIGNTHENPELLEQ